MARGAIRSNNKNDAEETMRFVRTAAAIVGLAALVICADASAQFLDVKILGLEGAKKAAAAPSS